MQVVQTELGLEGMTQTSSDIRCRLTTARGGQRFEERSTLVLVTTHTIYTDPNADVNEADRVQVYEPIHSGVLLPDGLVILIKPVYAIETIHHLEIKVTTTRSATERGIS